MPISPKKISTLMYKPDLSTRQGQAGRQSVIDQLEWLTVSARYLDNHGPVQTHPGCLTTPPVDCYGT